ncbi:MAG: twin-arginine translocation signal domain-containing protein, partial [Candidatus Methanofastidiosia archaeon]
MNEKESDEMMSRRKFLKLGGLLSASVGFGLARHYDIFNTAPKADFDYKIIESHRRPKADFEYKTPERTLSYINPTSAEEILFFPRIVED